MKNIIKFLILIISFNSFAQNEADFKDNIGLPNLIEVTTADTLLVVNDNKKVKSFITKTNLFSSIPKFTGTNIDFTDPLNPIIDIRGLQETTDVGNITDNKILIKRGTGGFTGVNTDLFVEADETQTGTTVSSWIANNRVNSTATDDMYGQVVQSVNSSTDDIGTIFGSNSTTRSVANGTTISRMKAGQFFTDLQGGSDVSGFVTGLNVFDWHTGTGEAGEMRGTDIDVRINNANASVTDMLGTHTSIRLDNGHVKGGVDVIFAEIDINTTNLGSTLNIDEDVTYFKADDGADVLALKNYLEAKSKKLRFFHNPTPAESDSDGFINVSLPTSDYSSSTPDALIPWKVLENELNNISSSPWTENLIGNSNEHIRYDKQVSIGVFPVSSEYVSLNIGGSTMFYQGTENMGLITPIYQGLEFRVEDGVTSNQSPILILKDNSTNGQVDITGQLKLTDTPTITTATKMLVKDPSTNILSEQDLLATITNVECYTAPSEIIVLRQDITAGASSPNFFTTPVEALSFNATSVNPATEGKYSIMDQVESFRKSDGSFEFILNYIDLGQTANWTQTSNPLDTPEDTTTGFNLISSTPSFGSGFQGMSFQNVAGIEGFYNGSAGSSWWITIGAKSLFSRGGNTGTPAVINTLSSLMELKVVNEISGEIKVFTLEDGSQYAYNSENNLEVDITAGIPATWIKCQDTSFKINSTAINSTTTPTVSVNSLRVTTAGEGYEGISPNGTVWRLVVDNNGVWTSQKIN
jgi:hypothetical protein